VLTDVCRPNVVIKTCDNQHVNAVQPTSPLFSHYNDHYFHGRGDYSSGHRNNSLCAISNYRNPSHSVIHLVKRKRGYMQLAYIMLVAGGVG